MRFDCALKGISQTGNKNVYALYITRIQRKEKAAAKDFPPCLLQFFIRIKNNALNNKENEYESIVKAKFRHKSEYKHPYS
jgi:hypothetical protein